MSLIAYQEVEDYVIQLKSNNIKVVEYKHFKDKFNLTDSVGSNVNFRFIRRYMKEMIEKGIVRSRMVVECTNCGMPNVIYDHLNYAGSCSYCNEFNTLHDPLWQLKRTWLIVN
ncbi:hypothetical protein [Mammaliicoccus sciuri]|uniref:hypothetical protein n=1 Tax=Mammaliicoccus sciuri TaxID=1296 RepID=UPI003F56EC36